MKQDELMGLLQEFSPKIFQQTLERLQTAYQADTANPVRNVFQALEAALSAPGVTQLEPVVRRNPLLAAAPDCTCDYCEHLRRSEKRRKDQKP